MNPAYDSSIILAVDGGNVQVQFPWRAFETLQHKKLSPTKSLRVRHLSLLKKYSRTVCLGLEFLVPEPDAKDTKHRMKIEDRICVQSIDSPQPACPSACNVAHATCHMQRVTCNVSHLLRMRLANETVTNI